MKKRDLVITCTLVFIAAALVIGIIVLSILPQPGSRFTEFYLLGDQGRAASYPSSIAAGQPVSVTIGIINHEGKSAIYEIRIVAEGAIIKAVQAGTLKDGQKWENKTDFTMDKPGARQKVEFYLYMNGEPAPHIKDPLTLLIDVINPK